MLVDISCNICYSIAMSETPKNSNEPVRLIEAINELAGQGIDNPAAAEAEIARKKRANLMDAENEVRDTSEQRAELIARAQGGEDIDPAIMQDLGQLALEARVREQQLQAESEGNNNS